MCWRTALSQPARPMRMQVAVRHSAVSVEVVLGMHALGADGLPRLSMVARHLRMHRRQGGAPQAMARDGFAEVRVAAIGLDAGRQGKVKAGVWYSWGRIPEKLKSST